MSGFRVNYQIEDIKFDHKNDYVLNEQNGYLLEWKFNWKSHSSNTTGKEVTLFHRKECKNELDEMLELEVIKQIQELIAVVSSMVIVHQKDKIVC